MADGHYFKKFKNCCFFAMVQEVAIKFGRMTHRPSLQPPV